MQREGVINGMHKSVRDSKADIDNFAKKLSARKREIEFLKEREDQAEKVKAEPIEAEKPPKVEEKEQVKETAPAFVDGQKPSQNNFRKFDNTNNQNRNNRPNDQRFNNQNRNFNGQNNRFNNQNGQIATTLITDKMVKTDNLATDLKGRAIVQTVKISKTEIKIKVIESLETTTLFQQKLIISVLLTLWSLWKLNKNALMAIKQRLINALMLMNAKTSVLLMRDVIIMF